AAQAQAGHFEGARETASRITSDWRRADALAELAAALAQAGYVVQAFETFGPRLPNEFVEHVAAWGESFDAVENGLSLRVLRECLRVIGWVYPDWREIGERL
ncbi:MAG: hypothetical protein D6737_11040, partial [Chloroflexi bacterium]